MLKEQKHFEHRICHTGQHFDEKMSKIFFDELELPEPDYYLGISGGSHARQTAGIMVEFEKVLEAYRPDLVVVPGDVNSTLACSLVATKMHIPVAHIESGLRSFNRKMPEEINRILTDVISDWMFVSEPAGLLNLSNEGVAKSKVFHVGNIMIDSLVYYLPKIDQSDIHQRLSVVPGQYLLMTFHRPENVDNPEILKALAQYLVSMAESGEEVIFPVHPRTRKNLEKQGLLEAISDKIRLMDPLGYIDFLSLVKNARCIVTDSGGIQEETTYLGVPCITARNDTERPVTVEIGTNYLAGTDFARLFEFTRKVLREDNKPAAIPELWDGKTAMRIMDILRKNL